MGPEIFTGECSAREEGPTRTLGTLRLCFTLAACATMSNTAEQD
jgi:hypothetical protein